MAAPFHMPEGKVNMKTDMQPLKEALEEMLGESMYQAVMSNPRDRERIAKAKVRPVMLKGELLFQETVYRGTQVFHGNYGKEEMVLRMLEYMEKDFRQCEIEGTKGRATALVSKKGRVTVKRKSYAKTGETAGNGEGTGSGAGNRNGMGVDFSHNRTKKYLLEEGKPVPFLVDLGVQTPEGKVVRARYDKFKQINRFLEFIEDILPTLPKGEKIRIIDFGCGKSYLTFAIYYYMRELKGLDVEITGLDLKADVIEKCSRLAEVYGYDGLRFRQGDIGTYSGETDRVDMVVTLHACDTATDYALAKAVGWGAKVILSVPCCQHEVNRQMRAEVLEPVFKYGLLKERAAALVTDAIRANLLEECGYDVQILEFIDMEHTPKNLLIRGVRKDWKILRRGREEMPGEGIPETEYGESVKKAPVDALAEFLHVDMTLQKLLENKRI